MLIGILCLQISVNAKRISKNNETYCILVSPYSASFRSKKTSVRCKYVPPALRSSRKACDKCILILPFGTVLILINGHS